MPHVDAWWREPLDLEGVKAKYGPRIEGRVPVQVLLMLQGGAPVGWIQWYRWADYAAHATALGATAHEAGLDLSIGEPELLGRGLGSRAIDLLVTDVLERHPGIAGFVSDPEARNLRSVRAFQKAGFHVAATVQLPGEASARSVMRRLRPGHGVA